MIDICAISDKHGNIPKIKEPFDLILVGGDNVNLYCQKDSYDTIDWYITTFVDWINSLPFKNKKSKVLWIAGNHEVGWENLGKEGRLKIADNIKSLTNNRAIYLEDSLYSFDGITVYGTPWCKIFGRWAFNKNNEDLKEVYKNIPYNLDILLTHDAPYGTSDICYDVYWLTGDKHLGNEPLRDAILEKKPKFNLHGHLHSANHKAEKLGDTDVYCISLLNEEYNIAYEPLYLELWND